MVYITKFMQVSRIVLKDQYLMDAKGISKYGRVYIYCD